MPSYEDEIGQNYITFTNNWKAELTSIQTTLLTNSALYLESYKRLTTLNTWRELIIKNDVSSEAYQFFCEAHNDAVSSHVFASVGAWREALKCLRSCMENVLYCMYYKDHPIELRLWLNNRHRMGFNEFLVYFEKHPDIVNLNENLTGLPIMKFEYSTLSRAVHASSEYFRMTIPGGYTNLWSSEAARINSWRTRERKTLIALNIFLISIYRDKLKGASYLGLRQSISLLIQQKKLRRSIQTSFGINLNI